MKRVKQESHKADSGEEEEGPQCPRPGNGFLCYAPKDRVGTFLGDASKRQSLVTPPDLPPRIPPRKGARTQLLPVRPRPSLASPTPWAHTL